MSTPWMFVCSALAGGVIGCGQPSYVFVPAQNADAVMNGEPASLYQIPPQDPQGDVQVASFGIQQAPNGPPSMHVRMIVSNDSDQPWVLDTRRQLAVVPGVGRVRAMSATSSLAQPPRISIDSDDEAIVDLFFPLPPSDTSAKELPDFDLIWRVQTNRGTITDRTRFDRRRVEPVAFGPEWGPYGWYDYDFYGPWYGYEDFYGPWYGYDGGLAFDDDLAYGDDDFGDEDFGSEVYEDEGFDEDAD
jgi:hypothetical protein